MSNFYARYVPPTKKANATSEPAALNGSTKRKLPEQDLALREPKKLRTASVAELKNDSFGVKRFVPKATKPRFGQAAKAAPETALAQSEVGQPPSIGQNVLDKYRVTGAAKKSGSAADVQLRKPIIKDASETKKQELAEPVKEPKSKKIKKKRVQADAEEGNGTADAGDKSSEDGVDKHTAVRDRFKKARNKSDRHQDQQPQQEIHNVQKLELHGLERLPQPPEVEQPYELPSYSTLPPWLAKADRISQDAKTTFTSLGLCDPVLKNLKNKGLENAMPIQSAVMPLLSKGAVRHNGDLAVAAATGSGKTLAYVLPIVEALKELAVTKLRGVIVVPTRELVKQVQEIFNMCAEGTNLRGATALGSKSIIEEAEALVESYDVYDPEAYAEQQSRKVHWAETSLLDLFDRFNEGKRQVPDHVIKYRSKVDVLICTPGRLVEHLQTTHGFSLDDVQWLVIDEVDRLLNESYQEWVEVVLPALQSRRATEVRDKVLQDMGLDLPPRLITKIILSATMTQDLSKLNSLNLRNPRLLILEGEISRELRGAAIAQGEAVKPIQDATGAFQLPGTLTETAVLVGDGSEKPLHLLELIRTRIAGTDKALTNGTTTSDSDSDTPSSDSSADNSASDSDSSSDSSDTSTSAQTNGVKPSPQASSKYPSTLIFTRSTSAAPRLSRLLSLLDPSLGSATAVLTRSTASSASSRRALKSFRAGTISILITTDRASRGLDIPNIEHVINYDVPGSVEFYVHRVGRTARAGKKGHAWSLVEHRQGRWFDGEIAKGVQVRRNGKVSKVTLEGVGKVEEMGKRYEEALRRLGEEVEGK